MLKDNVPSWELHLFKKWLAFSSPMGYLHFYPADYCNSKAITKEMGSRPLWGIYISITGKTVYSVRLIDVLVPYEVSTFLFFI